MPSRKNGAKKFHGRSNRVAPGNAGHADPADSSVGIPARTWHRSGNTVEFGGFCCKSSAGLCIPALHRLEARGLIASEWKSSDLNRRAKYYRLTPEGRNQLVAEQSKWKLLVKAIGRVMRPAHGD
jgi:hypothetical protein